MNTKNPTYTLMIEELDQVPVEYLPSLLKMVRAFREGVTLAPAKETLRQGWQEALSGQAIPIDKLWDEEDA